LWNGRVDCLQSGMIPRPLGLCPWVVFEMEVILGYRFLRFLDVEGKGIPGMFVMVYIMKT
jgi:hypothetical protein